MNLYTNSSEMTEGTCIFSMLLPFCGETGEISRFLEFGELYDEEENYLQRGEKILSLLRKKKQKSMFAKDQVLEMVGARWNLTQNTAAKRIGAKLEQKFLCAIEKIMDNETGFDACNDLCRQLSPLITVTPEKRSRQNILISTLCARKQRTVLNVCYAGKDISVPVGAAFNKRYEDSCRLRGDWEGNICVKNFKKLFSELYLRQYVLNRLRKMKEKGGEQYVNHCVIGKLQAEFTASEGNSDYQYLRDRECYYGILLFYPETYDAEEASLLISCLDLQNLLYAFQDDYKKAKEEAKIERKLSEDYAKSFQTKKNIPQKCIRAMSQSGFNNYFGYVEFDEECDLKLMEELYKEYHAFADEIGIGEYPEVSLRFRKLGNHKASGLYYYIEKCLCVDVRSPGSMVHEVGHMIDYHLGHISRQYSFMEIYDLYESLLRDYAATAQEPEAKILKGRTKYNLKYYLQPTEVFARCFEMYVINIRNINNSLCVPNRGFAYPENERLMDLIKKFYDEIFQKEDGKDKVA